MALRFFREYKVVVAGGERVGKSSFVYRFAPGYGIGMYDPRTIAIVDDEVALFDILDTAAQEEYSALRRQYMRDLEGMIIMYSITSRESFKETENFWKQLLCVKNKAYSPMLLVGNKSDRHGERQVSAQEGMALAKQFGCGFLEASAKEGCNVERAFHEIVREIRRFDSNVTTLSPLPETYQGSSSIFSKGILLSLLKGLFKSSKPDWNEDPEVKEIRQRTLNRMLAQYARTNDERRLKFVLESGADGNAQVGIEGNALHAAAAAGNPDIINVLIQNGVVLNARESRGNTALHLAALEGHVETVKTLLRQGVPVDTKCGTYGTALVAACTRGHTKVARVLLQEGADVSAIGGPFGSSFHAAAMVGKPDMAVLLHDAGAEIDSRGVGNSTALQIATFAGHVEVVKVLLDRNAGVNLEGGKYGRAVDAASRQGHLNIIELLVMNGATKTNLQISTPSEPPDFDEITPEVAFLVHFDDQTPFPQNPPQTVSTSYHIPETVTWNRRKATCRTNTSLNTQMSAAQNISAPPHNELEAPRTAGLHAADQESSPVAHSQYYTEVEIPFRSVRLLGEGAYGIVDEVEFTGGARNSATYARKILQNTGVQYMNRMIHDEISVLKQLRHKHIVDIIATYSISTKFAILMTPVADTNLKDFLAMGKPEDKMLHWFGCLAAGLVYMHSNDIRHRDIKPANILLKGELVLYTDFGIAKDLSQDSATLSIETVEAKSYMYCAPEVVAEKPRGLSSDVFSLGCVFLEMAAVLLESTSKFLKTLHDKLQANETRAYHAWLSDVLQLLLWLYILGDGVRWNGDVRLPLECCFAMLYPNPRRRISAQAVANILQNAGSNWRSPSGYMGDCCATDSRLRQKLPPIFRKGPNRSMLKDMIISHYCWDEIAERVGYTVLETHLDPGDQ